jgi:hypothetical protein
MINILPTRGLALTNQTGGSLYELCDVASQLNTASFPIGTDFVSGAFTNLGGAGIQTKLKILGCEHF